jgi:hypothetical protein
MNNAYNLVDTEYVVSCGEHGIPWMYISVVFAVDNENNVDKISNSSTHIRRAV